VALLQSGWWVDRLDLLLLLKELLVEGLLVVVVSRGVLVLLVLGDEVLQVGLGC
jgi:hypothetical protein